MRARPPARETFVMAVGADPPGAPARSRTVAVVGAGGYVGGRLVDRLVARGVQVLALGRNPARLPSGRCVEARPVDVGDIAATAAALEGAGSAYYLVHAMGGGSGFEERDREQARSFAKAAATAKVERIVYVGGLGEGDLSKHLASRQEVGRLLGSAGVPVVELRAAVVIGAGSVSFEMLRYLTERLPVMVCPRWLSTRLQPIAETDLLAYLEQSLEVPPGVYEIGGPDVTTYGNMIAAYARVRGLRPRRIVRVPMLTPSLSAHWVDLVTPVDRKVSHALIDSLANEVLVRDPGRAAAVFDVDTLGVEAALRVALDDQAERLSEVLLALPDGLADGVYAIRSCAPLRRRDLAAAARDLEACGGDLRWYGLAWLWRIRFLLGSLLGERVRLHRPPEVAQGARVDWWTVEHKAAGSIVLATTAWFCGEAWLGFRVADDVEPRIEEVGALRPKGLSGLVYWRLLWPIHRLVFGAMVRNRVRRAAGRRGHAALVPPRRTPRWRRRVRPFSPRRSRRLSLGR